MNPVENARESETPDILAALSGAPVADPLAATEPVVDAVDPLAASRIVTSEEDRVVVDLPVRLPPTMRERVIGTVRFFIHYCAISAAVFAILLVAANFQAYSELVGSMIDPGSYEASSRILATQVADARVAMTEADTQAATRDLVRARILERRFGNGGAEADSEEVADVGKKDPFSPTDLVQNLAEPDMAVDIAPYDNRIIIPKINKNVPLVDIDEGHGFDFDHLENIFMKELERGVVRYPGTAKPGQPGNAFVFGHSSNYPWVPGNYNQVFALIDRLADGDQIIVYYEQRKYVYTVTSKKVVHPGDVKSLANDPTKRQLSLMTCWPIGTNLNRMLVFAELSSDTSATGQAEEASDETASDASAQ